MANAYFLSPSPVLLRILSYVDYEGLAQCRLVNRNIKDVISKNQTSLPKPSADIAVLTFHNDQGESCFSVNMRTWKNQNVITVSPRGDIRYSNNGLFGEFYERNIGQYRSSSHDGLTALQRSLAQLLSLIFAHYFVAILDITKLAVEDVHQMSQVLLLLPRVDVTKMDVRMMGNGLPALVKHLHHLSPILVSVNVGDYPLEDVLIDLPIQTDEDINIVLNLDREEDHLQLIVDLIKKWQSGSGRLELTLVRPNLAPTYGTLPEFRWDSEDVLRAVLDDLPHSHVVSRDHRGLRMNIGHPGGEHLLDLSLHHSSYTSKVLTLSQVPVSR